MAKEAISRHNEGSEVALLNKIRSKIFLLHGFLMGSQHLHWVLGVVGFGIHVGDADFKILTARGPETKKLNSVLSLCAAIAVQKTHTFN